MNTNRSRNVRDDGIGRPEYQNTFNNMINNLENTMNMKVTEPKGNRRQKNRISLDEINLKLGVAKKRSVNLKI